MDYCVQLGFDNINTQEAPTRVQPAVPKGYGVDHVKRRRGAGLQGAAGHRARRDRCAPCDGHGARRRAQGPGGGRGRPRAGHEHRDGQPRLDNVAEFEELAREPRSTPPQPSCCWTRGHRDTCTARARTSSRDPSPPRKWRTPSPTDSLAGDPVLGDRSCSGRRRRRRHGRRGGRRRVVSGRGDHHGADGRPVTSSYAVRGSTAVVELASAVGLVLLPDGVADPLGASTFGLGTVVRHALEGGAREIIVGLGGSAINRRRCRAC